MAVHEYLRKQQLGDFTARESLNCLRIWAKYVSVLEGCVEE